MAARAVPWQVSGYFPVRPRENPDGGIGVRRLGSRALPLMEDQVRRMLEHTVFFKVESYALACLLRLSRTGRSTPSERGIAFS